jgi:streptogramin lyase
MDQERCDRLAAGFGAVLSRRAVGGLAAALLTTLGVEMVHAKKKKKKKKKPAACTVNCSGKQCGDNGCGGSCGSCGGGQTCNAAGQCVCAPSCGGRQCGDNGCGGSCGNCGQGQTCNVQGQCVPQLAYEFNMAWGSQGTEDGQFQNPEAIAADGTGNVFVTQIGNDRVQRFSSSGVFGKKWGAQGSANGQFSYADGIAVAADGSVYVVDSDFDRVQKFTSDGVHQLTWGSTGSDDGKLDFPTCVAVDASGNVYVGDSGNSRVQKFDSSGGYLDKFGAPGFSNGQFRGIRGIGVDGDGNIYVAEILNNRVQKFNSDGVFQTRWGNFGGLIDIAVAANGRVFTLESGVGQVNPDPFKRVRVFDSSGGLLTTFGSGGSGDQQFGDPHGIAVDGAGNVYVADYGKHRIQKFAPVNGASLVSARVSPSLRSARRRATQKRRRPGPRINRRPR